MLKAFKWTAECVTLVAILASLEHLAKIWPFVYFMLDSHFLQLPHVLSSGKGGEPQTHTHRGSNGKSYFLTAFLCNRPENISFSCAVLSSNIILIKAFLNIIAADGAHRTCVYSLLRGLTSWILTNSTFLTVPSVKGQNVITPLVNILKG